MKLKEFFNKFFGVMGSGKAYLTLIYNALAFPLGLFYFIFLVTGLSVSVPLIIVFVGLLLVPLMMASWWFMAWFERVLAIALLGEKIGPMTLPTHPEDDFWTRVKNFLVNPVTWKSLVYLLFKLPLGIIALIVLTVLGSLALSFLALPVLTLGFGMPLEINWWGGIQYSLQSPALALPFFLLGILMWPISLHASNLLGLINGWFARVMLGQYPYELEAIETASAEPVLGVEAEEPALPVLVDEPDGSPEDVAVAEASEDGGQSWPAVEVAASGMVTAEPELAELPAPEPELELPEPESEPELELPAPEPEAKLPAPQPESELPAPVEKEASGQKIKIAGELVGKEFGTRTFTRKVSKIRVLKSGVQRGEINYQEMLLQVERTSGEDNWEAKKVVG
ncbi:MAG: sensor domain-containing protein [Anaerolineales bacterium]|nr:sensor domain-containing protein [Anaerolineales bacterium]